MQQQAKTTLLNIQSYYLLYTMLLQYAKLSSLTADAKYGGLLKQASSCSCTAKLQLIESAPDLLNTHLSAGPGDLETCVACVGFVLGSAARFDVDSETLSNELQQLGLPKGKADF